MINAKIDNLIKTDTNKVEDSQSEIKLNCMASDSIQSGKRARTLLLDHEVKVRKLTESTTIHNCNELFLQVVYPYSHVELPEVELNNKVIHLYPTQNVLKLLKKAAEQKLHKEAKSRYIADKFQSNFLKIKTDTVIYYNDTNIELRTSVIKADNIYRKNNSPLSDKGYIFIIDALGRLIIDQKITGKYGRIQHSSLARGQAIKAAGILEVSTDRELGKRKFCFKNLSGHYQPTNQCLDHIEQLFASSKFIKTADKISYNVQCKIYFRELEFSADVSLANPSAPISNDKTKD